MNDEDLRLASGRLMECLGEAIAWEARGFPGFATDADRWQTALDQARAALGGEPEALELAGFGSEWGRRAAPYSPGPWRADRGQIRNRQGDALASVPYTLGDDQDHANGRLIAAAPELADAARVLLDRIDHITTDDFRRGGERREREALRAVLARIIGEEGA